MNDFLKELEECAGGIIEEELGRKVVLIDPDGKKHTKSALDPEENLKSAIFQESHEIDARTGFDHVTETPTAIFRLASLERVPKAGESWLIQIPKSVSGDEDDTQSYMLSGPPKPAKTLGFINFRLRKASQI